MPDVPVHAATDELSILETFHVNACDVPNPPPIPDRSPSPHLPISPSPHPPIPQLKTSPTAGVQMWLQRQLPRILPQFLQQKTAYDIFSRHTMVFSNVPGPSRDIYVCGERVLGMQVLFPNLVPQSLLISYADSVFFNMSLDEDDLPGPAFIDLPLLYVDELRELGKAFGLDCSDAVVLSTISPGGIFGIIG